MSFSFLRLIFPTSFARFSFSDGRLVRGFSVTRVICFNTTSSMPLESPAAAKGFHFAEATPIQLHQVAESVRSDPLYLYIDIETRGHDVAVLKSYEMFLLAAAKHLNILVSKTWVPSRIIWRRSVLKSPHIYAKHKVQYETRTNFRVVQMKHITGSTADTFLEYSQRNLPEGVAMKVTKRSIETMPSYVVGSCD